MGTGREDQWSRAGRTSEHPDASEHSDLGLGPGEEDTVYLGVTQEVKSGLHS